MIVLQIAFGIVLGLFCYHNRAMLIRRTWFAVCYAGRTFKWCFRMLFLFTPVGAIIFALRLGRSTFPKAYLRAYLLP